MNREILFRGKKIDGGEWVYGSLITVDDHRYIIRTDDGFEFEVDPATVGQYINRRELYATDDNDLLMLIDPAIMKERNRIFEGDVAQCKICDYVYIVTVLYDADRMEYRLRHKGNDGKIVMASWLRGRNIKEFKVIGNMYDNPELMDMGRVG